MVTMAYKRLVSFFESMGRERLDRLDRSYFEGMTEEEKKQSYTFLIKKFNDGSAEAVEGLEALKGPKMYDVFIERISGLRSEEALSEQRLSLSVCLWRLSGDIQYQDDMLKMLGHQNEFVRAGALSALEDTPVTSQLLAKLEHVCLNESSDLNVKSAAQQLLKRYGIHLNDEDKADVFRSIYRQLKSDKADMKIKGLSHLKKIASSS